jgi:hypothetical protein
MPLVAQKRLTLYEHLSSPQAFSGIHVALSSPFKGSYPNPLFTLCCAGRIFVMTDDYLDAASDSDNQSVCALKNTWFVEKSVNVKYFRICHEQLPKMHRLFLGR